MNSKIGKIVVVSQALTVVNGLKKYFCNQAFENVVFLHISFPQISPLLSLYKLYNLLFGNRAFPLLVLKNFNFNVHARHLLQPLQFAIKYRLSDLISSLAFPTDGIYIKKQRNISTAIKSFIVGLWK